MNWNAHSPKLRSWAAASAILWLFSSAALAQLAITEVLPGSGIEVGEQILNKNSDFWELTNFGKESIDLHGYKFSDGLFRTRYPLVPAGSPPLFIKPKESIVFFRDNKSTNEAQFRAWLGGCLSPETQVRPFSSPGLSRDGDGLALFDAQDRLVDYVAFGVSATGISFVYDPRTGAFGYPAILSLNACRQANGEAVGSPGRTTGPIPLELVWQPSDTGVCRDGTAELTVGALGMPPPRYQWFHNGNAVVGGNSARLSISNADSTSEGLYYAVISNGITALTSTPARVNVITELDRVEMMEAPYDTTVVEGRSARFQVRVCARETPLYQWYSNGLPILNATGPVLLLPDCRAEMSDSEFCVEIASRSETIRACARLWVSKDPILAVTELQSDPSNCLGHCDWFEVTNFGVTPVQMLGYRFNDNQVLRGAEVIRTPMMLESGESMIFVNTETPHRFFEWWGAERLPPDLKVYPFTGFSLNKAGDAIFFWNDTAELASEVLFHVSTVEADRRRTFQFDPVLDFFGSFSVIGEHGAFEAAECGDIGSPGYSMRHRPIRVEAQPVDSGVRLRWAGRIGQAYQIDFKNAIDDPSWSRLRTIVPTTALPDFIDPVGRSDRRYYRVSTDP